MSCQTECSIDIAAMRSIWDDRSPGKLPSFARPAVTSNPPSSSRGSFSGLFGSNSGRSSPNSFGPVGSPLRRASLASYDTGSGAFSNQYSSQQSGYFFNGTAPKRSSVSSLWDYSSSGYSSSGQQTPNLYSPGTSDYSSDIPSPRYLPPSYHDNHQTRNEREKENEKVDVETLYQIFGSLLMLRGPEMMSTMEAFKDLLNSGRAANRRASVASTNSHYFERERPSTQKTFHDEHCNLSPYSSMLSNSGNNVSNTFTHNQTGYETTLERIEREAKMRRTSAYQSDTNYTWKGTLTTRFHSNPTYATKVFVGGLPYDVTPEALSDLFGKFGLSSVQFPPRGRGHAYLVFETESQVQALLDSCEDKGPGQFFFWVSSRRGKDRQAQVIPWATEDSDWLASNESEGSSTSGNESSDSSDFEMITPKIENTSAHLKKPLDQTNTYKHNTVFVGALHGEITAEGLQKILSELFGPVVHVGIDTDKNRYPNGSARVTFAKRSSFHHAVLAEFVQVVTPRFSKTIQLDAYIEDGACSKCNLSTPVFCRHQDCFRYYCPMCFEDHRNNSKDYHPPVMRNRNNGFSNGSNNVSGSRLSKERITPLQ